MRQSQIAKRYGLGPTRLNSLLNGKIRITTLSTARKMAKILKMDLAEVAAAKPETLKRRFDDLYEYDEKEEK